LTVLLLCILGVAVLFIRPVKALSNPQSDPSIMVFSLMLILERFYAICQFCEVHWRGIGQKEMKPSARRDARTCAIVLPIYCAAFGVAASAYFGNDGSERRHLASVATGDKESSSDESYNDIPIILLFCGLLMTTGTLAITIICCLPRDGSHKEMYVVIQMCLFLRGI
jgi:hypothetical protein